MSDELTGHPMDHGWHPHKRETWPYRFAKLRKAVSMQHYLGYWVNGNPAMRTVEVAAGATVKIVMVSRLGDVGITEDLTAENGYGRRVMLDDLCDWSETPAPKTATDFERKGEA